MTPMEIAVIFAVVCFCIFLVALLPAILSLKKTLESLKQLLDTTNDELKPMMGELSSVIVELKGVVGDVKVVCQEVSENSENVKHLMQAIGETGTSISTINKSFRGVTEAVASTAAWLKGIKVAGSFFKEKVVEKSKES